ncbi:uncharacterized protein LOC130566221 [Triplophysa rosa]|uniref:uncharacterized protein LOC130566221 n=1 Tax=Triplophysa rosa TaxID=992332 RepID=UPI0025460B91|nr:uncharacterized protein LOC130566221 [Triplophysa rosa]
MFLQYLLACIVLGPFHSQAKVVNNFTECEEFFYKGKEPQGMDTEAKKICQIRNGSNVDFATLNSFDFATLYSFDFATLYSVDHRIPLYSAYTLDDRCLKNKDPQDKCKKWKIEPQLVSPDEPAYMMTEREYISSNLSRKDHLKRNQAISEDYSDTGYDRGHLYPNSFDYNDQYMVTYTLTNIAPMDPCFNRIYWKKSEQELKRFLISKLRLDIFVTVYIVTGAVPGDDRIPDCGDSRESGRVTVPSHIWTAVCYKHHFFDTKSFSFGYIAKNHHELNINPMSISDMNQQLSELYSRGSGTTPQIQIFDDDCFGAKSKVPKIFDQMKSTKLKIPPKFDEAQNNFHAVERFLSTDSKMPPTKVYKGRLAELTATLVFDSSVSYFTSLEVLKDEARSACMITSAKERYWSDRSELRKREVSEGSEAVQCLLVPEKSVDGKTAADGSPCSNFKDNSNRCTCSTQKGKEKFCCSTPCLYQKGLKGYRCYSGQTQIKCSPQYSLLAIRGQRCVNDHPCATYGEDYYWCYTAIGLLKKDWEYCSPPLLGSKAKDGKYCRSDHACAKYSSDPWCYTDDDENWNYCCTSDDCFSAVNYKTCKPDHPCGYYGKNYLWCRTTDDNWNYCCTDCRK